MADNDQKENVAEEKVVVKPAPAARSKPSKAPVVPKEEFVDFETWYAAREGAIPGHHRKEILKADFKGRKVPNMATMAQFDDALREYGIKLA